MSKPILITGATGKQGGALLNALLASPKANDYLLLAVTRKPESDAAKKLAEKGVKIVKGDLNNVPELFETAKEVAGSPLWGVFSVQVSAGTSSETEEGQGMALVDCSIEHSVRMFVYTSLDRGGEPKSWETPTGIRHFITKYHIEHHLRDKAGDKMMWTILRPTAFMDNWNPGFFGRVFATIWRTLVKEKTFQLVATKDIGIFASLAFLDPEKFNHKAIGLAGDEISYAQANEIFKSKTGLDMPESWEITATGILTMLPEVRDMFNWFYTDGYAADIKALKELHPSLMSWSDWLEKESNHEMKK
jgi:uncharacterized protein YbjT (DUF2867 family)